ncbi:carbohydrate kinase family protein [Candidatus Methylobacter oryzae]|uniref:Carbohydrate kinase n=1 Tax=Candidatus Methylobacter oryzae TaxID=2497749 RepID=A0ABY3C5N7_9GAMM|nr:carbohydrate kinase [Candidatus Methylobacter oryzae]TRW90291.1 carbohydrate kinase [Candidatus Methylobacter oryzae]
MVTNKQIAIFGEALFDQFPDGRQILGGAPFNVAWHLQAFKQLPRFISRVGNDRKGDKIRQAMQAWGMAVENLACDPDYPTGTVQVTINNGEPDYEILADQAYDFINAQQLLADQQFSILYHGTLALRNRASQSALHDLIAHHQGKIFIDVNLRAPWWQKDAVNGWLDNAHWAKLNHEELAHLAPQQNTLTEAMRLFLAQHQLEVLVVTCASRGAAAIGQAGEFIEVAPESGLTVADTVGAGDAFAAVLLLGMQLNWPLQLTMQRAQSFASALVTQRGATVQDLNFYRPFIDAWNLD